MMILNTWRNHWRKAASMVVCASLAWALSACFLAPGKFNSSLDLRKDGTFTFNYQGEIYLLGLTQLAKMADDMGSSDEFIADTCYDEETYEVRECTAEELELQRENWSLRIEQQKDEDERNSKAFATLFGGLDPSDPEAADEIAAKLRRQRGWNSVEYKGDGLYAVDFSITSRMTHDFTFPVFEGFTLSNGFVTGTVRDDNVVRIDAPGFSAQSASTSGPSSSMLQFAALMDAGAEQTEKPSQIPQIDGTFAITTDGAILSNNTDEGPQAVANGQKMSWKVTRRTMTAPMALVRLGN